MNHRFLRWGLTGILLLLLCLIAVTAQAREMTGLYELYVQGNEGRGIVGYMRIFDQSGGNFSVRSATSAGVVTDEWQGRGAVQGNSGIYSWRFRDGRTGQSSFSIDRAGNLLGQVRGSDIDWNYLARKTPLAPSPTAERWQLTRREFPVLGQAVVQVTEGRNAGSSIKVQRTARPNEVNYIDIGMVRGQLECRKVSAFTWSETLPETIVSGQEISIQLEARVDLAEGTGCGQGRISVSYGSRAEPLRDRAPNIFSNSMVAAVHLSKPGVTEIFRVNARPDLPGNDMFTVAIHISDGGVTDEVVALYVYEKVKRY